MWLDWVWICLEQNVWFNERSVASFKIVNDVERSRLSVMSSFISIPTWWPLAGIAKNLFFSCVFLKWLICDSFYWGRNKMTNVIFKCRHLWSWWNCQAWVTILSPNQISTLSPTGCPKKSNLNPKSYRVSQKIRVFNFCGTCSNSPKFNFKSKGSLNKTIASQ